MDAMSTDQVPTTTPPPRWSTPGGISDLSIAVAATPSPDQEPTNA